MVLLATKRALTWLEESQSKHLPLKQPGTSHDFMRLCILASLIHVRFCSDSLAPPQLQTPLKHADKFPRGAFGASSSSKGIATLDESVA